MSRRRNSKPPFEIMSHLPGGGGGKSRGSGRPGGDASGGSGGYNVPHEPEPIHEAPQRDADLSYGDDEGMAAAWWARAKYPVVLRVPRGYVALAGLFLVSILILAYMAGRSQGYGDGVAAMEARYEAQRPAERGRMLEADIAGLSGQGGAGQNAQGTAQGQSSEPPLYSQPHRIDPRKVGMNYFVLAHDDEDGARRLLNFLWDKGIDAAAFQVGTRRDYYKVVALEGFRGSEWGDRNENWTEYRRTLQRIGAEWSQQPGGIDFLRQGMYGDRYNGEQVARVIVRDE